eukprot:gene3766-4116_t
MTADERTRWTAVDSFLCKYQAHQKKYYDDPFAELIYQQLLAKKTIMPTTPQRKSPIINRGYYARVVSNRLSLEKFLESTNDRPRQFLFLGVGYDTCPLTAYDHASSSNNSSSGSSPCKVFEVDFPDLMRNKAEFYRNDPHLAPLFQRSAADSNPSSRLTFLPPNVHQHGDFTLIGSDLRHAPQLMTLLESVGFDKSVPTFIHTECVLVYLDKEVVSQLCASLASYLEKEALWVSYDMITPNDRYGQMMVRNLQGAGFHIPGMLDYPTLEAEKEKFIHHGWDVAHSCTMKEFYNKATTAEEKARLKELEMLDEVEEWNMIMEHYSLTIASKGSNNLELVGADLTFINK